MTAPVPSDIDGPTGEAGDLIEPVATLIAMLEKLINHKWPEYTDETLIGLLVTGCDKAAKYMGKQASALAAYQARIESAERMYRSSCSRADHAEAAFEAAEAKVAALTADLRGSQRAVGVWREQFEASDRTAAALRTALAEMLEDYCNEHPFADDDDDPDCPSIAIRARAALDEG